MNDYIDADGGSTHGNHPDADGVMFDMVLDNQDYSQVSPEAFALTAGRKLTISRWQSIETNRRGLIDMNYVIEDGSVTRYRDVRWDEGEEHERFTRARESSDGGLANALIQLPTR